jgi:hypothetical protein
VRGDIIHNLKIDKNKNLYNVIRQLFLFNLEKLDKNNCCFFMNNTKYLIIYRALMKELQIQKVEFEIIHLE